MAGEEQSQPYVGSLQGKSHRQHDPHSNGLLAPSGGFEPPLFDRFHSGEVEILVSGRALNQDILDSACVADMNFQQRRPLKALSSAPSSVLSPWTVSTRAWKRSCSQPLTVASADGRIPPRWRYATLHANNGARGSARPLRGCAAKRNTCQRGPPTIPTFAGYGPCAMPTIGCLGAVDHARKPQPSKASARRSCATR